MKVGFSACERLSLIEKVTQGDDIPKRNKVIILHSVVSPSHQELEPYARDVALGIEKLELEGIIVKVSPTRVTTIKMLRQYAAEWLFDLHSDAPSEYDMMLRCYSDLVKRPYPLASVVYGGYVWDPENWRCHPIRNRIGVLLDEFQKEKYGTDAAIIPSCAYPPTRYHKNRLNFGLLFIRPLDQSIELVKSLAQYLQSRSIQDETSR